MAAAHLRSLSENSIWLRAALFPPGCIDDKTNIACFAISSKAKKRFGLGPTTEFSDRLLGVKNTQPAYKQACVFILKYLTYWHGEIHQYFSWYKALGPAQQQLTASPSQRQAVSGRSPIDNGQSKLNQDGYFSRLTALQVLRAWAQGIMH